MTDEPTKEKKKQDFILVRAFRELRAKWHDEHIAYRDVLGFDDERKRFILNRSTIVQKDIVADDLQVDNEKWKVFQTPLELPNVPDTRVEIEDGVEKVYLNPTPISYNLYYESDTLNNASAGEFRSRILNPMVLAVVIGVGVLFLIMMVM